MVGVLESIPAISNSRGVPLISVPLSLILTVSMVRAIYEEYQRYCMEINENEALVTFYHPAGDMPGHSSDIR